MSNGVATSDAMTIMTTITSANATPLGSSTPMGTGLSQGENAEAQHLDEHNGTRKPEQISSHNRGQ